MKLSIKVILTILCLGIGTVFGSLIERHYGISDLTGRAFTPVPERQYSAGEMLEVVRAIHAFSLDIGTEFITAQSLSSDDRHRLMKTVMKLNDLADGIEKRVVAGE